MKNVLMRYVGVAITVTGFSSFAYADCPYDSVRSVYDCTGATTAPAAATQFDMRSDAMIARDNGLGGRGRGGCVAVRKSGTISYYDCTTQALQAVPEAAPRAAYTPVSARWGELGMRWGYGMARGSAAAAEAVAEGE